MDIHFQQPGAVYAVWIAIIVAVIVLVGVRVRSRALSRFAERTLLAKLVPGLRPGRAWLRALLVLGGLAFLTVALFDPRWGERFEEVQQRGVDVVVLLDVSRSMNARDVAPSRFERAREYIRDLSSAMYGDRIALVTFAGSSSVQCPLTVDVGAFRLALDTIEADGGAVRGGTLLGDALRRAVSAFTDDVPDHKVVIVFTDGEDHDSYPIEAAAQLGEAGIRVVAVGLGDETTGAPVPVAPGVRSPFVRYEGEVVESVMNASLLRDVALESGGVWVPAGTRSVDMVDVYDSVISGLSRRDFEQTRRRLRIPRFQWFAGAALALVLLESFMSNGRVVRHREERA